MEAIPKSDIKSVIKSDISTVIKILLLLDLIGYFYPLIGNMVDFKLQDLDN